MEKGTAKCKGSLTVYTEGDDGTFGKAEYKAVKYPKFYKRLKNKTVKEIEVKGDCCWELYPRKEYNLAAKAVFLESGHHKATIRPRSMKKVYCL